MRAGVRLSLVLGTVLLLAGIVVDETTGWLEGRGFLTNVLSSLTGFFFAVPLAVLVLSEVNAGQEERRAVRAMLERASTAAESIALSGAVLAPPEPSDLRARATQARRRAMAIESAIAPDADDRLAAAAEALTAFLNGWTASWLEPSAVAASLVSMEHHCEELTRISARLADLTGPLAGLPFQPASFSSDAADWRLADSTLHEEIGSALAGIRDLRGEWASRPTGLDQATLRALVLTTRTHDVTAVLAAIDAAVTSADRLTELARRARALDTTLTFDGRPLRDHLVA
ncbi:hypothetical protein [Actinomadura rudentiformis]|uniref:Uncharacterized protein n=1 Tax=Actinomadura rudentiformis TaxID=359158 RepID=A0A6H9YG99_9ACTN|nr:hypothetical protein [Actinomadura rudentiformis]KAB2344724.1 hypothetical protein F8566_29365 [Actinomadura rudentiformis]